MPTWKRIKIVEGLIWYRNHMRKTTSRLEPPQAKLQECWLAILLPRGQATLESSGRIELFRKNAERPTRKSLTIDCDAIDT